MKGAYKQFVTSTKFCFMRNKFSGFYSALKYTSIDILMKPRLISDVLKNQFYIGNKQFVSFKKDKNSAT